MIRGARLVSSVGVGYLLGTTPSADLAAKVATGGTVDLRTAGTGNPGAINALHLLGPRWGYAILAADIAKGASACALGRRIGGAAGSHLAGSAAVAGHCFPVWSGFRGGKGVAASAGQCLATFPAYFPVDVAVAWAAGRWRGRTLPATVIASLGWVAAGVVWWRRRWPNAWGPVPDAGLPAAAAVSSALILSRFAAGRQAVDRATGHA